MAFSSVVVAVLILASFHRCTATGKPFHIFRSKTGNNSAFWSTFSADTKPEVTPEVENNNEDDELDGLIVSGGPEYVYEMSNSRSPELSEEEDSWFADEVEHHLVKRQTPSVDQYLRTWGEVLIVGRSHWGNQPLHYTSAYNPKENKYLIIYDAGDIETDLPKHVYAAIYNPICIQHPGTRIGEILISRRVIYPVYQGWPVVAYNPHKNGYLVLYQISPPKRNSVLVGQRIRTEPTKLILDGDRFLAFNFFRRGRTLPVSSPAIVYTPETTGYIIAAEVRVSYLNIFIGCLTSSGSVWNHNRVYAFRRSSAYNPELVYDPIHDEVFVIATADRSALAHTNRVETSLCVDTSDDYVLLVTKRTATCQEVYLWERAVAFGSSKLRFPRVRAVWDEVNNVLIVAWDSIDTIGNEVSLTVTIDGRNVYCDSHNCSDRPPMMHSFLFHNQICNQTVTVWEENIGSQWLIGGSDFPAGFLSGTSRGQNESYPRVLYEERHDNVMVIWKDSVRDMTTIRVRCLKRLEGLSMCLSLVSVFGIVSIA